MNFSGRSVEAASRVIEIDEVLDERMTPGFVMASSVLKTAVFASTLSAIYTAAVYRYATEGDAGGMFDAALVRDAFRRQ